MAAAKSRWPTSSIAAPARRARCAPKRFDLRASTRRPSPFPAAARRATRPPSARWRSNSTACRTSSTPTAASSCWWCCRAPTRAARTAPSAACSAQTSALGVHTVGWKAPTEDERAHDYLWRIHQQVPAAGEIVIFNRSHYEDVLVPVVNGWITPRADAAALRPHQRLRAAAVETGTVVCKFLLHISKDEQRAAPAGAPRRPDQALEVRRRRPGGAQAVGRLPAGLRRRDRRHRHALGAWTIVPADSKTHRNLMIASVVKDA